jgi:hypothetical protein
MKAAAHHHRWGERVPPARRRAIELFLMLLQAKRDEHCNTVVQGATDYRRTTCPPLRFEITHEICAQRAVPTNNSPIQLGASMNETSPERGRTRRDAAALPPAQRSAVTNNRRLFIDGDGNSAWARRYKDLLAAHCADMGGADAMSTGELSLARRCATLGVQCEHIEGVLSLGGPPDPELVEHYSRLVGHLRRALETMHKGLDRRAKQAGPLDIKDYAARVAAAARQPNPPIPPASSSATDVHTKDDQRASGHTTSSPSSSADEQPK